MKPRIRSYKDLLVWQRAVQLFVAVTSLCRKLPRRDRLVFDVQLRKAARSVSSNIGEGHERYDLGDYLRHLSFARSTLAEAENDLVLIDKTTSGLQTELSECNALAEEVGRMLTTMSARLRRIWKRSKTPRT